MNTLTPPSELLKRPDIREAVSCWKLGSFLHDEYIAAADELMAQGDPGAYLDWYNANKPFRYEELNKVVPCLPPKTILTEYGEGMLFAASYHGFHYQLRDSIHEWMATNAGYDADLLKNTRAATADRDALDNVANVRAGYSLADALSTGWLDRLDVASLLQKYKKPGASLSAKQIGRYSLQPFSLSEPKPGGDGYARDWKGLQPYSNHAYNLWIDAPASFGFFYNGLPEAVVSFVAKSNGQVAEVRQMQGVRANILDVLNPKADGKVPILGHTKQWGLEPVDWRALMLDVVGSLARHTRMSAVGIQRGAANKWRFQYYTDGTPHMTLEQAEQAYDVPPDRLHFTRDLDGNWIRPL